MKLARQVSESCCFCKRCRSLMALCWMRWSLCSGSWLRCHSVAPTVVTLNVPTDLCWPTVDWDGHWVSESLSLTQKDCDEACLTSLWVIAACCQDWFSKCWWLGWDSDLWVWVFLDCDERLLGKILSHGFTLIQMDLLLFSAVLEISNGFLAYFWGLNCFCLPRAVWFLCFGSWLFWFAEDLSLLKVLGNARISVWRLMVLFLMALLGCWGLVAAECIPVLSWGFICWAALGWMKIFSFLAFVYGLGFWVV